MMIVTEQPVVAPSLTLPRADAQGEGTVLPAPAERGKGRGRGRGSHYCNELVQLGVAGPDN